MTNDNARCRAMAVRDPKWQSLQGDGRRGMETVRKRFMPFTVITTTGASSGDDTPTAAQYRRYGKWGR